MISVYVKYSSKKPYLPEAVADSPKELARILGTTRNRVLTAIYHNQVTFAKVVIEESEDEQC